MDDMEYKQHELDGSLDISEDFTKLPIRHEWPIRRMSLLLMAPWRDHLRFWMLTMGTLIPTN